MKPPRGVILTLCFQLVWACSIVFAQANPVPPTNSNDAETSSQTESVLVRARWPRFAHDNANSGVNSAETIIGPGNVSQLVLAWKFPTLGWVRSSPAVANGMVYISSSLPGTLHAFDELTGVEIWSAVIGGDNAEMEITPALADGMLFTGNDLGTAFALNPTTGQTIWSNTVATGEFHVGSPLVFKGMVYLASTDGNLYALDEKTGALIWQAHTRGAINHSPALWNGVIYAGSMDKYFYAFDAITGQQLWKAPGSAGFHDTPSVSRGVIFTGNLDDNVYAFNAVTGKRLWTYQTGGQVHSTPIVYADTLYFGSQDGSFYALNPQDGSLRWSIATGDAVCDTPAAANGVVYIGSYDNVLRAVDPGSGAVLWSYATGGMLASSPAVVNGQVIVGSDDGSIYAFSLKGGEARKEGQVKPVVPGAPLPGSNWTNYPYGLFPLNHSC